MRNLDICRCWRCTLWPCNAKNNFFVNFSYRTIVLCIPCTYSSKSKAMHHVWPHAEKERIWMFNLCVFVNLLARFIYSINNKYYYKIEAYLHAVSLFISDSLTIHYMQRRLSCEANLCLSNQPTNQNSEQTNIHAPAGIRTHDISRRAAADLRLTPRGQWDRWNIL